MVGLEAQMHVAKGDETAHEQTGSDKQGKGNGDLKDHDGVAETAMRGAAGGAFAAVAQGIVEISANDLKGGSEAKNDRGEPGTAKGENEHGKIEADYRFGGNDSRGNEGDEAFES